MTANVSKPNLLSQPAYVSSVDKLTVYSQLAQLLACEDIAIRWNVLGLDAPAEMNYATRVLSVAPIKAEHEHLIPGLILHEVGHFLFSFRADGRSADGRFQVDVDKLNEHKKKIKSHLIYNIIEDGYIERRLVVKWPGALKHLRALFNFYHGAASFNNDEFEVLPPQEKVVYLLNMLLINALGTKFGTKYSYPAKISAQLRQLLEQAVTITGMPDDRAQLSSKIVEALSAEFLPSIKGSGAGPTEGAPTPTEVADAASREALEDLMRQQELDAALSADALLAEREKWKVQPVTSGKVDDVRPQAAGSTEFAAELVESAESPESAESAESAESIVPTEGDVAQGGVTAEKNVAEAEADAEQEQAQEQGLPRLEEFISNAKARMIRENLSLIRDEVIAHCASADDDKIDRLIPNEQQVLLTSQVVDILSDQLQKRLSKVSFLAFTSSFSRANEQGEALRKLLTTFNKKVVQARARAQQMYQRFITKANAMNVALATRRRVGLLDPTRLALFKIYDDIFKRHTIQPNQPNHGYVLMVDWSTSMNATTMELFHRTLELVMFAQLAKVEVDIWLYTTIHGGYTPAFIKRNIERLPVGMMYVPSKFVHVLNTRRDSGDALLHRLFALFINAAQCKADRSLSYTFKGAATMRLLDGLNFADEVTHETNGTNIFEAISFAKVQAEKLQAARRCIMLMTDGQDGYFVNVIQPPQGERRILAINNLPSSGNLRVMFNNINIIDVVLAAKKQELANAAGVDKWLYLGHFNSFRVIATTLLADSIRRSGTSIVGVCWNNNISPEMHYWARENIIIVNVPREAIRSRNINTYAAVKNEFIESIIEALLANIRPTQASLCGVGEVGR